MAQNILEKLGEDENNMGGNIRSCNALLLPDVPSCTGETNSKP